MHHEVLLSFFLLLFSCFGLKAQDYLYPASASTLWGGDAFALMEQSKALADRKSPRLPASAPKFYRLFTRYEQNMRTFIRYNDSIYADMPKEDWVRMFQRRARKYSEIFQINNADIARLETYFANDAVPAAAYDSLHYWVNHMLYDRISDVFLYEDLMNIVIPHYRVNPDDEHLVSCFFLAGLGTYQCYRMGEEGADRRSLDFFRQVLQFADRFPHFSNPLDRYYLIGAFVNIVVTHAQSGTISLDECVELAGRMRRLFDSPECQALFGSDPKLAAYAQWSLDVFSFRAILTYISRRLDNPALRDRLYAMYCDVRQRVGLTPSDAKGYYGHLLCDDCLVEAFMGNMSWNEAFDRFVSIYQADPDMKVQQGKPVVRVHYLYNTYSCFAELLDRATLPREQKRTIMKNQILQAYTMLPMFDYNTYPFEIGQIIANIVCSEKVLRYLTESERLEILFRPFVMEQPTTFVHVSMVADLSRILASALIADRPGYFVGVPGYPTTKEVRAKQDELIDFIYHAALYHDLGKIVMPTVIANNYRRITDHEYEIIKKHPEQAMRFLETAPSLHKYRDIALGHHKWYNGQGYPSSFSNRQSPYFPVICLITMCDCMDAATENISRNYHTAKTFEKLMREVDLAAAAQYHPALLKFLNTHPDTYRQMKECISDGRYAHYIDLYKEFVYSNR